MTETNKCLVETRDPSLPSPCDPFPYGYSQWYIEK